MAKLANAQGEDTHTARQNQRHGEVLPDTGHPSEGAALRYGFEVQEEEGETEPTRTGLSLTEKAKAFKEARAASKVRAKVKAKEWAENFRASKKVKPGMFDTGKYRCWMMGNGQSGR